MTNDGRFLNEVELCPICQQPFKRTGLKRHITVKHGGVTNIAPDAPPCQSEPSSPIPAIPEPIIGDEALRANQSPLDDLYAEGLAAPVDDTAYTELDAFAEAIVPAVEKEFVEAFSEVEKKLVNPPIPSSPQKVISQIPVNSEIMLQGECYWQNPATFDWELAVAEKIQVVVVGLETVDNVVHLMCKVAGGQALWSVLQSDVLEGKYRIIKLATPSPNTAPIAPPNGKREFAAVQDDLYKKAFHEFLPIFNTYLEAKEKLEVAEKMFADVHESSYQTIENFVLQYGETIEDEGDTPYCVLEVDGVRMRLVAGDGMIFEKI